jgi:hypothetical protein
MKKLFVVMGLLLIATMLFVGCGKTDNSATTQAQPLAQTDSRTGSLQGKIMNALTGAALGNDNNSELKVWLIQGTDNRGASKLVTDTNDPLCGEYAFDNIPIDLYYGNATFKVVVVKSGYQRFEADVELNDNLIANDDGMVSNTFDRVINMIGNIYLFPEGTLAGDVTIVVLDSNNTPLPNANIKIYQDVENNNSVASNMVDIDNTSYENGFGLNPTSDVLYPTGGLYTSMSMTTDSNGVATVSGTSLVLGGKYTVWVAGQTFGGEILSSNNTTFTELTANVPVVVKLSGQTLYAISASNQNPGTITASGVLTVTFNQPIALTTTGFDFSGLDSTNTVTTGHILADISADGLTMTLTPASYCTGTTANKAGSIVTFTPDAGANATPFILKNSQTASILTFNGATNKLQNLNTNSAVSNVVRQISN